MQIQKLEDQLDVQIFDRSKKPIELTEVGHKIVAQAKNIVEESERIRDIIDQEKGFVGGEFKLGVIPTIMPTLLPMFLKQFIKKYPHVQLKIKELNTEEITKQLSEGHLDAALAATPLGHDLIKERVLYYEPFVAYIPASHRLSNIKALKPDDLDINDMLLLEDGHCFKESVLNICGTTQKKDAHSFNLASGSFETLVKLANEGLGMTLLPYLYSKEMLAKEQVLLKQFIDPKPAREVSLIYPKSELKIQIIEALQGVITSIIRGAIAFQDVKIIRPTK
jgi:LysR family hydrogen peroxide-inducible transcriptional activator